MYLLIDIGNENTKWQCGASGGVFASSHAQFSENLNAQCNALTDVSGVVFVNVANPKCAVQLHRFIAKRWQVPITEVKSAAAQCGVRNSYRDFTQLGADRWAALIGARSVYAGALIAIDSGTAITVDALRKDGTFIGGSILPGFTLAQAALWQRAPGIEPFDSLVPQLPARSTAEAVSSGVVYATVGGVERLIAEYREHLGEAPKLLLTGGSAALVAEHSSYNFEVLPNLTLTGLAVIAKSL